MLNLRDHVRLSNAERLHLAQAFSDLTPSPIGARERVRSTVLGLRQAAPPRPPCRAWPCPALPGQDTLYPFVVVNVLLALCG
jgi:hypothetical protein